MALKENIRRLRSSVIYLGLEKWRPGEYYSFHCFDYYKCLFVHIPRTAGISVSMSLFGNLSGGHQTISKYRESFPAEAFADYFKFSFVRNPWERLYSAFNLLKKGGLNAVDLEFKQRHLNDSMDFREFVLDWMDESKTGLIFHLKPQCDYLTFPESPDVIAVDFLGRFENLSTDFSYVASRLGIPGRALSHMNETVGKRKYHEAYTPEMAKKISRIYERDIRLLKYEY